MDLLTIPHTELEARYNHGVGILTQLQALSSAEIIEKLRTILPTSHRAHTEVLDYWGKGVHVTKVIADDVADEIRVNFYDTIKIHPFGINYQPEHRNEERILEFNQHFVL